MQTAKLASKEGIPSVAVVLYAGEDIMPADWVGTWNRVNAGRPVREAGELMSILGAYPQVQGVNAMRRRSEVQAECDDAPVC